MQPPDPQEGSPEYWLRRARSVLQIARLTEPSHRILAADLCFNAQQATEKAIKAVLVATGSAVPKIHEIEVLLQYVPDSVVIPTQVETAARLTVYAIDERYGGSVGDVTSAHLAEAIVLAQAVYDWAERIVERRG